MGFLLGDVHGLHEIRRRCTSADSRPAHAPSRNMQECASAYATEFYNSAESNTVAAASLLKSRICSGLS